MPKKKTAQNNRISGKKTSIKVSTKNGVSLWSKAKKNYSWRQSVAFKACGNVFA
jgi:hypothetical protein